MKILKQDIRLSTNHPSTFFTLAPQSILAAPVVIDQNGNLIDGYRRYQLQQGNSIEAVEVSVPNIFDAAYDMNLRTRSWDDLDCFLWIRWGRSLHADTGHLPTKKFPSVLDSASPKVLSLLAERKISMRQAALIEEIPLPARDPILALLSATLNLNDNETQELIRMSWDMKTREHIPGLSALFASDPYAAILENPKLTPRKRGEALLKELRAVRYPLYQKKLEHVTSHWQQLNLGPSVQIRRTTFVERGILEISFSSSSFEELKQNLERLSASLNSPLWGGIWEE